MSVSSPLLKSLKDVIIKLCVIKNEDNNFTSLTKDLIMDDNENLQSLCEIIEEILRKGLYRVGGLILIENKDYWTWLSELPKLIKQWNNPGNSSNLILNSRYEECLEIVKRSNDKVDTNQGKGRLMLRCLLQSKILHWPIEILCLKMQSYVLRYYSDFNSLLANEILVEMLVSQLTQLSKLNFRLNLINCLFLDESWLMPVYKQYEFVPCKQLGVNLVTIQAYQVVETLHRGSVAAEQQQQSQQNEQLLEPGDVLDQLFGHNLKWTRQPLREIMQANHNLPVSLSVVKSRMANGTIYPPIYRLLRRADLLYLIQPKTTIDSCTTGLTSSLGHSAAFNHDNGKSTTMPASTYNNTFPDEKSTSNTQLQPMYGLRYVGSTYIGCYGGVTKIEGAIAETLKHYNDPNNYLPVYMELGEKDVIIRKAIVKTQIAKDNDNIDIDNNSGNTNEKDEEYAVLFAHAYPQISSCGRRIDCTRFLAYIVGESTCTISRHFVCHVFEAKSEAASKSILTSIAQGFERTHWTI